MWESTVRVGHEEHVDADPEQAWALIAAPAALSAMPGRRFAFAVPDAVQGTDRLCCMIVAGKNNVHCAVVDVREEVPGQLICWQVLSAPARNETLTLSVRPRPGGCTLSVAISLVVARPSKIGYESYWRRTAKDWARRLKAIAEGQVPAPPDAIPAEMRKECVGFRLPRKTRQASASVLINADAAAVWDAVHAPESTRLIHPDRVVWAGTVPGTPRRAVGEMQCAVSRYPADRFRATVSVVSELTEGRLAVTQNIGSPDEEILHLLRPVSSGTLLELTTRWPANAVKVKKKHAGKIADAMARHLQADVEGYKALAEKAARPPR